MSDMTIRITGVTVHPGSEQPVAISYDGDQGKPWKPCKSMCRILVACWGPDSSTYAGRSVTLYRDPTVKWGGLAVGGIRISHISDIGSPMTMALTETRGKKSAFTVNPQPATQPTPPKRQARAYKAEPTGDEFIIEPTGLSQEIRDWAKLLEGDIDAATDLDRLAELVNPALQSENGRLLREGDRVEYKRLYDKAVSKRDKLKEEMTI
jgi:hypothetical protein